MMDFVMSKHKNIFRLISYYIVFVLLCLSFSACSSQTADFSVNNQALADTSAGSGVQNTDSKESAVLRDNTPVCLVPVADGTSETHNDVASIDYSHASDGYIGVKYSGTCSKVKMRIVGSDQIVYTYDITDSDYEFFPLTSGDGSYTVTVYENISGNDYSTCLFETIDVKITDELGPALYPNQYVNFSSSSKAVQKAAELAEGASSDLDVVTAVYDYIISNISYDYTMASDPPTGYISDIDQVLEDGTGICLDYAALMAAMLRSQQIPTRLEVGYAKDVYHAWISVYIHDVGWVNGVVEFDGTSWTLVDPTFGANTADSALKKFIGDGSNYTLQKIY
jgi:transglutaminase/protease-like cytokinesis protein 3